MWRGGIALGVTIWIGIFLLIGAVYDIKYRKIPVWLLAIGGITGVCYQIIGGIDSIWKISGMLIGLALVCMGVLFKNSIGLGDGMVFLVLGIYNPISHVLALLLGSSILAAIFGSVIIFWEKGNLKSELPFIPFVCLGYIFLQCISRGIL